MLQLPHPGKGFEGSGEEDHLFSGIWREGSCEPSLRFITHMFSTAQLVDLKYNDQPKISIFQINPEDISLMRY